jgi:hypothetical protein
MQVQTRVIGTSFRHLCSYVTKRFTRSDRRSLPNRAGRGFREVARIFRYNIARGRQSGHEANVTRRPLCSKRRTCPLSGVRHPTQPNGWGRRGSIGAAVADRSYKLAHPSPSLARHSCGVALAMCPRISRSCPALAKRRCRPWR